ncbi:TrbG/VirB9 family P-type conjugative transfer protein, partial [Dolichospermum sp. ST_sed4]|nr:TrbG/VirB9 family P-type conjugative transfer protein [Dolichospermum sp. ST_sed4]
HLMLHATAKTYMASVAWRYPDSEDGMIKDFDDESPEDVDDITNSIDVDKLKFVYQVKLVKGSQPDWYPRMVFTDGKKTYIKFSGQMQEAPTLFLGTGSKNNQVVNYR